MQPMVRYTVVTPAEFWKHGYRTGWDDHAAGRAHRVDEAAAAGDAEVIPFPGPEQRAAEL